MRGLAGATAKVKLRVKKWRWVVMIVGVSSWHLHSSSRLALFSRVRVATPGE